jgi:hypothetical protein
MRQVVFELDRKPTRIQSGDRFRWDVVNGTVACVRGEAPLHLLGDSRFVVGREPEARRLFRIITACLAANLHPVFDGTDAVVYEVTTSRRIVPGMIAARFQVRSGDTTLVPGDYLRQTDTFHIGWARGVGYTPGPLMLGEQPAGEDPFSFQVGPSLPTILALYSALTGLPYERTEDGRSGEIRYTLFELGA